MKMESDVLGERKKKLFKSFVSEDGEKKKFLNFKINKSDFIYYLLLIPIIIVTYAVRTQNLRNLRDKYLMGLDPYFFYRYALTIVEKGSLPVIDYLRYFPIGYATEPFSTFSYTLAYMYNFFHLFSPDLTVIRWFQLYPPLITAISIIFFFLFVREFFGNKIALLASAFLAVVPGYLYRTSAGFADHEALAMLYLFISLWFFALMWKSDWKKGIFFAVLSGLFTGLMASTWGAVRFLIVGLFLFIVAATFFIRVDLSKYISYTIWIGAYVGSALLFKTSSTVVFSFFTGLLVFANIHLLFFLILQKKKIKLFEGLKEKVPSQILSLIILTIIGVGAIALFKTTLLQDLIRTLISEAGNRFQTTVAESMRPYFFNTWTGNFGWLLLFAFLGFAYVFYKLFKNSKKYGLVMFGSSALFSLFFILSMISGKAEYSTIVGSFSTAFPYFFMGFPIFIVAVFWFMYLKDRDVFNEMFNNNWAILFIILFFLVAILIGKTNTRVLFFVSVPIVILASYFIITFANDVLKMKNLKYLGYALLIIAVILFLQMASDSFKMNQGLGSHLPGQWETSMLWLKNNTPEDAVIAHWWDYGYWTQTIANRASIGDGGNLMGWNHHLGRQAMTGENPNEYLSYLKTHGATHLLFSREEIGKYHAFSFIGSDENLDRSSTIGTFILQEEKELRNGTRLYYQGSWGIDKDLVVGNLVIPQNQGGIFAISIDRIGEEYSNPVAYLAYNNNQHSISVSCLCYHQEEWCKEFEYNETENYLESCITLAPYYQTDTQMIPYGTAFWTSSKVKDGLMGRLYIQNEEISYFREVYNDTMPLGLYQGNLIGPMRIWEIQYPDWVEENETYLERHPYG